MTGPLGHRRFRILLAGRAVSMLGNAIAPVAIAFAVLDLTESAAALGIVLAARSIPQVLFMLAGGVIADRFDRARVLVIANVVAGVAQGAAALLLTGTASVPALAVLEAVNGTASAIVFPAAAALTPVTVPSTILQEANALLRLGLNTAMIVGAASGGILVGTIGSGWGLAVDAMALSSLRPSSPVAHRVRSLRTSTGRFTACVHRRGGRCSCRRARRLARGLQPQLAVGSRHCVRVRQRSAGRRLDDPRPGRGCRLVWSRGLGAGPRRTDGGHAGRRRPHAASAAHPPTVRRLCGGAAAGSDARRSGSAANRRGTAAGSLRRGRRDRGLQRRLGSVLQQQVPSGSRVYSFDALGSYAMIPLGQLVAGPLALALGTQDAILACATVIAIAIGTTLAVPSVRHLRRTDVPAETPAAATT